MAEHKGKEPSIDELEISPGLGHDLNVADLINASGHVQELDRNFGLWSICAVSVVVDNAWAAGAGSLVTALYDGGPPGVLYELLVACFFYCLIGASIAELASAIPSSASVYHWASVTAGKRYGRICSWYAGWWSFLAWMVGVAAGSLFGANSVLAVYALYHDDFLPSRWQIFIAYLVITWVTCAIVLFGQRILPKITNFFTAYCILVWFVSLMVCAIMPSMNGSGYASHAFVWKEWNNQSGYSSNGFVFCLGMLNGAYAIGTPDGCTHCAEELPDPKRNIPKGIVAQLLVGTVTTFTFYIAILYAISDIDEVFNSPIPNLPLAAIYLQATNSRAATTALLVLFIINNFVPGAYIVASRTLWVLARDNATPFSKQVGTVSPRFQNPFIATLICGFISTLLGCIYIVNASAFNAFIGIFNILTTMSYLAAILPHLLTRRRHVLPGPFWMPTAIAYIVGGLACAYILIFNVIYMFPYALPTDAATMNYSCLMTGGTTIFITLGYLWKRNHGYVGPRVLLDAKESKIAVRGKLAVEAERLFEERAA